MTMSECQVERERVGRARRKRPLPIAILSAMGAEALVLMLGGCSCESSSEFNGWDTATDRLPDPSSDTVYDNPTGDPVDVPQGDGSSNCDERAKWIYLVDSENAFIRFKPDDMTLTVIGTLNCPTSGEEAPFSMSVDRSARAWVLFVDMGLYTSGPGKIYQVSTSDASCQATSYTPGQRGFEAFGMGFVSDAPDSEAETLFISGGAVDMIADGNAMLGSIAMGTFAVTQHGTVPQWPELTGTGLAELWGFFPASTPPMVAKIDKWTGTTSNTFNLPSIQSGTTEAWAFAFWGGDFFLFLKKSIDTSSNIWKLTTSSGQLTSAIANTGYRIVGAGVSTCAPTGPI